MEAYTQQVALQQLKDENKDKARLAQKLAELEVSQQESIAAAAQVCSVECLHMSPGAPPGMRSLLSTYGLYGTHTGLNIKHYCVFLSESQACCNALVGLSHHCLAVKLVSNVSWHELQDPIAQHQKLAKIARIAIRTLGRQRSKRSPAQNSELLAKSNAVILR